MIFAETKNARAQGPGDLLPELDSNQQPIG